MSEMVERPREVIARVHAERDIRWKELGSGEIADTIIAELEARGFVIVPREPTEAMIEVAQNDLRDLDIDERPHSAPREGARDCWRAMIDKALK